MRTLVASFALAALAPPAGATLAPPAFAAEAPQGSTAPRAGVAPAPSTNAVVAPARLPIIEDDFARARAEAKARAVPMFVEVWAPW